MTSPPCFKMRISDTESENNKYSRRESKRGRQSEVKWYIRDGRMVARIHGRQNGRVKGTGEGEESETGKRRFHRKANIVFLK